MSKRPPRDWSARLAQRVNPNGARADDGMVQIASFGTRCSRTKRKLRLARLQELERAFFRERRELTRDEMREVFYGAAALKVCAHDILERLKRERSRRRDAEGPLARVER